MSDSKSTSKSGFVWRAGGLAAVAVLLATAVSLAIRTIGPAEAATFVVTSVNDSNDGTCDAAHCSLREAIGAANANPGADSIGFSVGGVITLTDFLPAVVGPVTIDGGNQVTVRAGGAFRGLTLDSGADGSTIRDIAFDGNGQGDFVIGLFIHDTVDGVTIEHVEVRNFTGDGILFEDTTGDNFVTASDNVRVADVWVHDNKGYGVKFRGGSGNTLENSVSERNMCAGLAALDTVNLVVAGNRLSANVEGGLDLFSTTNSLVQANQLTANDGFGIRAIGDRGLMITRNEVLDNTVLQVQLTNASAVDLTQNDIRTPNVDAVWIEGRTADVAIGGGGASTRNRFRGLADTVVCDDATDACYVKLQTEITVPARQNDWGSTDLARIENWVCHQEETDCAGFVDVGDPLPPGDSPAGEQQVPTPTPTRVPLPPGGVAVPAGCGIFAFMPFYAAGTPLSEVAADVTAEGFRFWFLIPGTTTFNLYDPRSAERSSVTSLAEEAGFVCADAAGVWSRPA